MIWDFQDALTRRLLLWSVLSMAAGAVMLLTGDPWWRGFGLQAFVWGAVDAAIALAGRYGANKGRAGRPTSPGGLAREAAKLRRLLWINTGLDVLYMLGGAALILTIGRTDPFAEGTGWGIVLQGGFLFVFDLLHALAVPKTEAGLPVLAAFDAPEHQPFTLEGDRGTAVLVHGFGGTPAELRSIAAALHQAGWTVDVPLLPGFGSDLSTLTLRRHEEWLEAVEARGQELQARHAGPLMMFGYSMGAALVIATERALRPAGLVLLAPFWWEEKAWLRIGEFFIRPFLPTGLRPLQKADLTNGQFREGISKFMPGLDLDDPAVQQGVRNFQVPTGLIDELRRLSRAVLSSAPKVSAPVLVIQGARDTVARPGQTRKLVAQLPGQAKYVEVDSEHDLTLASNPHYAGVEREVLAFADSVTQDSVPDVTGKPELA